MSSDGLLIKIHGRGKKDKNGPNSSKSLLVCREEEEKGGERVEKMVRRVRELPNCWKAKLNCGHPYPSSVAVALGAALIAAQGW